MKHRRENEICNNHASLSDLVKGPDCYRKANLSARERSLARDQVGHTDKHGTRDRERLAGSSLLATVIYLQFHSYWGSPRHQFHTDLYREGNLCRQQELAVPSAFPTREFFLQCTHGI